MTEDPDKEHGTNKPPPTGRARERSKGDTACPSRTTIKPNIASHAAEQLSWVSSPRCSPPGRPFPIKSLALSARVSSDNSFPSVRQEPSFGPWKGSLFLQQMVTLVGLFAETDVLTTRGTQGPACLPMDQTQHNWDPFVPGLLLTRTTGQSAPTGKEQETLLTSLPSLSLSFPNPSYPSLIF